MSIRPNPRYPLPHLSVLALLCLTTAPALAQSVPADTAVAPDGSIILPPIILSAGLTPVPQDEYGRAATVLDGQALRDKGVQTVADALREAPGVTINGNDLSLMPVRIRGHNGAQTLVVVDGVEQVADLGGTNLGNLSLADVDRIEVLRGPQAASYGIGASAGVVAIYTNRATQQGLHYGTRVEAGGADGASVDVGYRGARGGISFAADYRDDEGWDVSGDGGERDGVISRGYRLSGDVAATEDLTLGFSLRRVHEEFDFDSPAFSGVTGPDSYITDDTYPHGETDRRQGQLWAEARYLDGRLTQRLSYDLLRDERVTASSPFFAAFRSETERRVLRNRVSYALDGQAVEDSTQVVSLLAERVEDDSPTESRYERATNSLALEYRGEVAPGLSLQLAGRRDNNDAYEDATSWNAALAYVIPGNGIKLHASAGDGRRKPVFFELFGDGQFTLGNPDLTPERNRSLDLGVTVPFAGGSGSVDVTLFRERLTDRITYITNPDFTGVYQNVDGTSRRKGVELSAQWQATDVLALRGHGTWISAKDPDGTRELRIPQREIGIGATYSLAGGRGSVGADLRHVAGVRDTDRVTFQPVELDSYTVLDVSGRWAINDRADLTLRVENLTDEDYSDAYGYAARGRTAYVSVGARF